jgi:cobalamin synthase
MYYFLEHILQSVELSLIFGISLFFGMLHGFKKQLSRFFWAEAVLAAIIIVTLLLGAPYEKVIANGLLGFFIGFSLHPLWELLIKKLSIVPLLMIVVAIMSFIALLLFLIDWMLPNVLTIPNIFVAVIIIWILMEIIRRRIQRKNGDTTIREEYF